MSWRQFLRTQASTLRRVYVLIALEVDDRFLLRRI
jgi:hypothetical protein